MQDAKLDVKGEVAEVSEVFPIRQGQQVGEMIPWQEGKVVWDR